MKLRKGDTVEVMRPYQPLVPGVEDFIVGDVVEVFYEYGWKTAAILKVLQSERRTENKQISLKSAPVQKRCYLVRLFGCSAKPVVDESQIRTKQTQHDGKWFPFEKRSRGDNNVMASKPSTSICHQNVNSKKTTQNNCITILDEGQFMESHRCSRMLLKRVPTHGSIINESHNQKFRAIEKDGRKQKLAISITNSRLNSSDSDATSVGSCSVTGWSPNISRETDTVCSYAESGHDSGFERESSSLPPAEVVEISIRRLELQAYRRTLEALYVSGPLSWEQETMLTDLRIMLHISNDEHLTELKNLTSAKTAVSLG